MIRAEGLLPDRQRALVERLGLRVLALVVVQLREVVQARGHIGMIRAEGLLPDRQRALVERLGLRVLALGIGSSAARLFRLVATSGWSGPTFFSAICSACFPTSKGTRVFALLIEIVGFLTEGLPFRCLLPSEPARRATPGKLGGGLRKDLGEFHCGYPLYSDSSDRFLDRMRAARLSSSSAPKTCNLVWVMAYRAGSLTLFMTHFLWHEYSPRTAKVVKVMSILGTGGIKRWESAPGPIRTGDLRIRRATILAH